MSARRVYASHGPPFFLFLLFPAAVKGRIQGYHLLFQRCGSHNDFEGGTRFITVGNCPVPSLKFLLSEMALGLKEGLLARASISPVKGSIMIAVAALARHWSIALSSSTSTIYCNPSSRVSTKSLPLTPSPLPVTRSSRWRPSKRGPYPSRAEISVILEFNSLDTFIIYIHKTNDLGSQMTLRVISL